MDVLIMDIPQINGESQIKGYEKKIELLSYSHGVAMQVTGDVSNRARTSGRPMHQDFTITKYLDIASASLNKACCMGNNVGQVKITVGRNDSGTVLALMVYTLEDVVISSISVGGGGGKPVETVTLNYSKITWEYDSQKPSGGKEGTASAKWDLKLNQAA